MNPFSILGVPTSFALSKKQISDRKVELSLALHPDRYVGRPASERRAALGKALEVNEAARRLSDPVTRAEALLEILGFSLTEENGGQAPPEFLMTMMELRQELRQAGQSQDKAKIEALGEQVKGRQEHTLNRLTEAFADALRSPRGGPAVDDNWQSLIFSLVGELRYFRRFFDEAEGYLDEIP